MATWPTIVDDDGTGTSGTPIDVMLFSQVKAYVDGSLGEADGLWVNVPFAAGNFGATGGTWTVAVDNVNRFSTKLDLRSKTFFVQLYLVNTVIGGSPFELGVILPYAVLPWQGAPYSYALNSGVNQTGVWLQQDSTAIIKLYRDIVATPFAAGTLHIAATFTVRLL